MEGTNSTDSAYEVQSNIEPASQPLFTEATANTACQVVSLRHVGLLGRFHRIFHRTWTLLGDTPWTRLLPIVMIFALAGGVTGGLLAAVERGQQKQEIDPALLVAGVNAMTQPDTTPRRATLVKLNKKPETLSQLNEPEIEFNEPATEREPAELPKRRASTTEKKAYMVGVIAGKDDDDERDGNKRERKRRYWDDEEP